MDALDQANPGVYVDVGRRSARGGPDAGILGTAGSFAILAKTGISTTGVTAITGDIGVSPVAATYVTGFGLIMDASGTFSTSSLSHGKNICRRLYCADSDQDDYGHWRHGNRVHQRSRTIVARLYELYAGDLTGKTLTPGLYKWGTGVMVSAGGVTISGTATMSGSSR